MQREYEVIYQEIEDGWIIAIVPDLPGAVTQGQDMDQARTNSTRRTTACGRTFCSRRCTPTIHPSSWRTQQASVPEQKAASEADHGSVPLANCVPPHAASPHSTKHVPTWAFASSADLSNRH